MKVGYLEIVCSPNSGECYAALWGIPVIVYFMAVALAAVILALVLLNWRERRRRM